MKLTDAQKAVLIISSAYGIGVVKGRRIIDTLKEKLPSLLSGVSELRRQILDCVSEKDYKEICAVADGIKFGEIENELTKKEITVVTTVDADYPKAMIVYDDAPLLLYCKGDTSLLNTPSFAVVGTRFPTKYGIRATEDFTAKLSERFCIVSGMARGVDSCAHRTALECRGKTVAVLGCGVDVVYPPENAELYSEIEENGLLVSEYKPGENANAHNFPARNRIISGLSRAVLITEAGEKSGTMLTLNYALNQGKDVYCVPGSIYNQASAGCNKSIKRCQTRAVTDVNDIYDELGMAKVEAGKPSGLQLDVNEDAIINALTKNGEMHFEEILQCADLSVPQLNSLLIKMTAVGLITKTKQNYWSI
jgi:DNA processing protein